MKYFTNFCALQTQSVHNYQYNSGLRSCSHEFDSDPAPNHIYHLIQNEACKLTMTENGGMYLCTGCSAGVLCALPSGVQHPLKKTLVFHI